MKRVFMPRVEITGVTACNLSFIYFFIRFVNAEWKEKKYQKNIKRSDKRSRSVQSKTIDNLIN